MKQEKNIEIPFGASDSELHEFEYTIPEGYEAKIKDGKVIVRKAESEDEKTRKEIISILQYKYGKYPNDPKYSNAPQWIAWLEKQGEQKPAWSEEDEEHIESTLKRLDGMYKKGATFTKTCFAVNQDMDWLKSLKDRVTPQPKQEWSQNDIDMIDWLIRCCEKEHKELCNDRYGHQEIVSDLKRDCRKKWDWLESLKNRALPQPKQEWSEEDEKMIEAALQFAHEYGRHGLWCWLKSLRPQSHWKPSDEQMEALDFAAGYIVPAEFCIKRKVLKELLEQLKKLK